MNDSDKKTEIEQIADKLDHMSPEEREHFLKVMMMKKRALRLLVVILSPEANEKANAILQEEHMHLLFKIRGEGTANSELLDLLGLGSSSKIISICIVPHTTGENIMARLIKELRLRAPGNGIAFSIPLSGAAAPIVKIFNDDTADKIKKHFESEVDKMKTEATHEVVLSVVNPGYSEELMDAARTAGATGGTVVHARQVGSEAAKVWGITLQGEREIVAILVRKEQKVDIMKAINAKYGMSSEAQGLTISLPVDSVAGLEE